MSDLPSDITKEILLRLPARSLLRLRLVCKQWRSLISDPKFVWDHAHRVSLDQSNRYPQVIISQDLSRNPVFIQSIIDYESLGSTSSTSFEMKLPTPHIRSSKPIILGCCNGMWILNRYNSHRRKFDSPVLWNPLVSRKYKRLPRPNFDSYLECRFGGFGYTSSGDYKVVTLCKRKNDVYISHDYSYSKLLVEVNSLKTNSWRIIPARVPPTNIAFNDWTAKAGTHVNGSIYWYIYDSENAAVIAFDLITETFKLLEPPTLDGYDDEDCREQTNLVKVRGRLGAYRSGRTSEETVIWIWNEDENKKGGYWTQLLTIPPYYPMHTRVLSFPNNNQVLLHASYKGSVKLVIYDSASRVFNDIPCGKLCWPPFLMAETLVSPVSF